MDISVVIITRNEGHIISKTLQSLQGLTDDIIIVDSGSTDDTLAICRQFNVTILEPGWNGYGPNKNKGIDAARHNWILNIDADEVIDEELKQAMLALPLLNANEVFEMWYRNFFMDKCIRHGEWGNDKHIRLFNRTIIKWNEAAVHENLTLNADTKITLLKGFIKHYTVNSLAEYEQKTIAYAKLNAQKYFEQGKRGSLLKQYLSPVFSFLQNYFFRLGFLDGKEGLLIAKTTARYTFLKYAYLNEMIRDAKR
ncbi:MAG: glycosyltransferase family 2 protein [Bacteroidota bacterium]